MNLLSLGAGTVAGDGGGASSDVRPLTIGFWFKAGAGFALGAGSVYLLSQVLWLLLVIKSPALLWWRWLVKF